MRNKTNFTDEIEITIFNLSSSLNFLDSCSETRKFILLSLLISKIIKNKCRKAHEFIVFICIYLSKKCEPLMCVHQQAGSCVCAGPNSE